jgi:hypothetical protein
MSSNFFKYQLITSVSFLNLTSSTSSLERELLYAGRIWATKPIVNVVPELFCSILFAQSSLGPIIYVQAFLCSILSVQFFLFSSLCSTLSVQRTIIFVQFPLFNFFVRFFVHSSLYESFCSIFFAKFF